MTETLEQIVLRCASKVSLNFAISTNDEDLLEFAKRLVEALNVQEPVAWVREFEGDVSDLGEMIFASCEGEKDENPNWIPLYAAPKPGEVK